MFLSSLGLLLTNSPKLSLIPKQGAKIQDEFYQNFMPKIETANVFVPEEIGVGSILSTYGYFSNEVEEPKLQPRTSLLDNLFSLNRRPTTIKSPPFVLIHGFDSSCLEFRKLAPLLADRSDVYVPDILGWGFSDVSNATSFTPVAKVEHLRSFIQQVVGQPCVLVGASLGGAVAIQLAAESPELVKSLVLIDAQGFIEGSDGKVPDILAKIGIQVLKAWPLRIYAGYLSYYNKALSTLDACRIGRLHCVTDRWMDSSVAFLQSGGFRVTSLIPSLRQKTLVLWGRQDGILDVKTAEQFREALPTSDIVIFDECGHVPHLEKPFETKEAIFDFLSK